MNELDTWWASLKVVEKEHIATKATRKDSGDETIEVKYPECSRWWLSISEERKQAIHDHCTDKHGLLLPEWKEGKCMSY